MPLAVLAERRVSPKVHLRAVEKVAISIAERLRRDVVIVWVTDGAEGQGAKHPDMTPEQLAEKRRLVAVAVLSVVAAANGILVPVAAVGGATTAVRVTHTVVAAFGEADPMAAHVAANGNVGLVYSNDTDIPWGIVPPAATCSW